MCSVKQLPQSSVGATSLIRTPEECDAVICLWHHRIRNTRTVGIVPRISAAVRTTITTTIIVALILLFFSLLYFCVRFFLYLSLSFVSPYGSCHHSGVRCTGAFLDTSEKI